MYKYEMHLHSKDVSPCASASAEQIVETYLARGYDGINVTNHWSQWVIGDMGLTGKNAGELADFYVEGYRKIKEAAAGRLKVFCGIELTLDSASNDYLIYDIDREFVEALGVNFWKRGVDEVAKMAHDRGCMIFQAHPFRNWSTILAPNCFRREANGFTGDLDGMETINYGNADRYANDIAMDWAEKHGIRPTCGADFHNTGMQAVGGVFTEREARSAHELLEIIKSGAYTLSYYGDPIGKIGELYLKKRFTK